MESTDSDEDTTTKIEAPAAKTNGVSRKKKRQKSKINDTSHDFSSREIAKLQESEAVFHSSLFRLQVRKQWGGIWTF